MPEILVATDVDEPVLELSHDLPERLSMALTEANRRVLADEAGVARTTLNAAGEIDGGGGDSTSEQTNTNAERETEDRATDAGQLFRDELARRAPDLDLLNQDELVGLAYSVIVGGDLTAVLQTSAAALEQQVADEQATLARVAGYLADTRPDIASHIEDVITASINMQSAEELALDILGYPATTRISTLVDASLNPDLDENVRQTAAFDALLAMTYVERLVLEQAAAARTSVSDELEQLGANSRARARAEGCLHVVEQLTDASAELRRDVEWYFEALTDDRMTPEHACDLVDALLISKDDLLCDHITRLREEDRYDGLIERALSSDPAISENARRQIQQDTVPDSGGRDRRISPITDATEITDLVVGLVTDTVRDAVVNELLNLEDPLLAIDNHAEARLLTAYAVLDLIFDLRQQDAVNADTAVAIGGAIFQLGKGSALDDTQAAHQLAGQIYLGTDAGNLAVMGPEQRAAYRLDNLLSDSDVQALAAFIAASTTILPSYVNSVDSDWERLGLRDALQGAIQSLLQSDSPTAVLDAYENYRTSAAEALIAARQDNVDKWARFDNDTVHSLRETLLQRKDAVFDRYMDILDATDARQAQNTVRQWLQTILDSQER